MKWQPIETAPKDGSLTLLFGRAKESGNALFLGRFRADYPGGEAYWHWGAPGYIGMVHATHWMPLPEPPNEV